MPRVCLRRSQTKAKRCLFTQLDVVEANLGEKGCVLRDDTSKGTDSKLYVYIYLRVCVYQRKRERERVCGFVDDLDRGGSISGWNPAVAMTTKGPLPPSREFHPNSTPRPPPPSLLVSTCGVTFFFPRFDGSARARKERFAWCRVTQPGRLNDRGRSWERFPSFFVRALSFFLSFSANPFRSGTFFLSFLFFFLFKGEGFLFFFLYFYFIFVSLWNPWEKLEILCKGNDLSIFINFINSIVAS